MNKYTIYCTTGQTRKAYVLGAPIDIFGIEDITRDLVRMVTDEGRLDEVEKELNYYDHATIIGELAYCIPTAEQMLGWLEEHGIFIHIDYDFHNNDNHYKSEMCLFNGMTCHKGYFPSRKEATLAAVDKALEYLSK